MGPELHVKVPHPVGKQCRLGRHQKTAKTVRSKEMNVECHFLSRSFR